MPSFTQRLAGGLSEALSVGDAAAVGLAFGLVLGLGLAALVGAAWLLERRG